MSTYFLHLNLLFHRASYFLSSSHLITAKKDPLTEKTILPPNFMVDLYIWLPKVVEKVS